MRYRRFGVWLQVWKVSTFALVCQLAWLTSAASAATVNFASLTDVSDRLTVDYKYGPLNRRTGEHPVFVTITNTSAEVIGVPLAMVITSVTFPDITIKNSDGATTDGKPYVDLSSMAGGDGLLSPNETALVGTVVFINKRNRRFVFEAKYYGLLGGGGGTFRAIADVAPTSGNAPLTVRFRSRAQFPGGSIVRYRWDYEGDGTFETSDSVARDFSYTYRTAGTYNPTLEVTNNIGEKATDSKQVVVSGAPPTATANANPSNGPVPLNVNFTCTASDPDGTVVKYEWDFDGDGTYDFTSTGNTAAHTYTIVGTFNAACRVTDNSGMTAVARTTTTVIRPGPAGTPSVTAAANPIKGLAPLAVSFSGTATDDGQIVKWEWDFEGDGTYDFTSATSAATNHTYTDAGVYPAALRVTDNDGLTSIDNIEITVELKATLAIPDDTFDPSAGETAQINTTINAPVSVKVLIQDADGVVVRTLVDGQRAAGSYSDTWDGTNDAGNPLPQAAYYAILEYKVGGQTYRVDLTNTTGGTRYNPSRNNLGGTFYPFKDDLLEVVFTVPSNRGASEIQAFVGLFNTDTRFITLADRVPFGVGTHRIYWDGRDPAGNPAKPPPGETFLFGIWGFTLPDNAIMLQSAPVISNVSVDPNFFDPSTGDFLSPANPTAKMKYDLNKPATVELSVTNLQTNLVLRRIVQPNTAAGTNLQIAWDGKADNGLFADKGDYRLTLQAVDSSGSRSIQRFGLVRVFY